MTLTCQIGSSQQSERDFHEEVLLRIWFLQFSPIHTEKKHTKMWVLLVHNFFSSEYLEESHAQENYMVRMLPGFKSEKWIEELDVWFDRRILLLIRYTK